MLSIDFSQSIPELAICSRQIAKKKFDAGRYPNYPELDMVIEDSAGNFVTTRADLGEALKTISRYSNRANEFGLPDVQWRAYDNKSGWAYRLDPAQIVHK